MTLLNIVRDCFQNIICDCDQTVNRYGSPENFNKKFVCSLFCLPLLMQFAKWCTRNWWLILASAWASFRTTSYMLEFDIFVKTVEKVLIKALNDKFSQFSANNQYLICMEDRPEPNQMQPVPASLTIFTKLITYCLYIICFSGILLVCELVIKPIQVRIAISKRRARKFIRHNLRTKSTNPKRKKSLFLLQLAQLEKALKWSMKS